MSGPRRPPPPGPQEDADWVAVTKSVKPLGRKPKPVLPPRPATPAAQKPALSKTSPPRVAPVLPAPAPLFTAPKRAAALPAIEPRLLKAVRRGQTLIDLKIDLHGFTQDKAHRRLTSALAAAHQRGQRIVLIITGTGVRRRLMENENNPVRDDGSVSGEGPGVLKRALPHWLRAAPFSDWVIGVSPAAIPHGGAGAVYVVLRRARTG